MTLSEDREYFNSPSVYRGSTPKEGREFEKDAVITRLRRLFCFIGCELSLFLLNL